MNYSDIKKYDTANASGINLSVYFSGCTFSCKNCFNQAAQDFSYGNPYTEETEDLIITYLKDKNIKGLCLLGGEVFQQDLNLILRLVKRAKEETKKTIWLWTGYEWPMLVKDKRKLLILNYIDVLIDGRFEIENKNLSLKYKGSSNQRVIDVQKSLKENKVILYEN